MNYISDELHSQLQPAIIAASTQAAEVRSFKEGKSVA